MTPERDLTKNMQILRMVLAPFNVNQRILLSNVQYLGRMKDE